MQEGFGYIVVRLAEPVAPGHLHEPRPASHPAQHLTTNQARAEAERLAALNPGVKFAVYAPLSVSVTPPRVVTTSIDIGELPF